MTRSADLVLTGGTVLTMAQGTPAAGGTRAGDGTRASAVAVRGERILAVGSDAEVRALAGPRTRTIDLAGRTVLPGLADVHTHVASNARDPRNAECRDFFEPVASIDDILSRLAAVAATRGPDEWVVGIGGLLQDTRLREARLPTLSELDEAMGGRPGYVTFGPHLIVASSAALKLAGIDATSADPQGGEIDRDAAGRPTGVLREQAQHLVRSRRPPTGSDLEDRIHGELVAAAARGVTTVHEIVKATEEARAFQRLAQQGRLPVRVHLVFRVFQSSFATFALRDLGLGTGFGSDVLRVGGVKVSVDGGDDKRTGFYPLPGDEERGFSPLLRMRQEDLDPIVRAYHEDGMRVCVHANGDMATDMALASFAKALGARPHSDHRHRIEHMGNFMLTPERLERANELGLVPVPNPTSLYYVGDAAVHGLGSERVRDSFPFRRLAKSGATFAIASDGPGLWPIDPLRDVATCVSRVTRSGVALSPDESLEVMDGLIAMTRTAAWLGFVEDDLGTVEPGKLADLAVLGRDPLSCPVEELARIPVDLTLMGGQVSHAVEAAPATA